MGIMTQDRDTVPATVAGPAPTPTPVAAPEAALSLQQAHIVEAAPSGLCRVRLADRTEATATLAPSCLVRPESGDTVMLAIAGDETRYVLAVLARRDDMPTVLATPGPLHLAPGTGDLVLNTQESLILRAGEAALLTAPAVQMVGGEATLRMRSLLGEIEETDLKLGRLRLFARQIHSVADHLVQKLKTALRLVDETDRVEAGAIEQSATGVMSQRGRVVFTSAREDVRIDGERIHIG